MEIQKLKQTVYLREIHYNDWLVKSYSDDLIDTVKQSEGYFFTAEQLNEYTANVIKQALENAAGKADITYTQEKTFDFTEVNKQSITNTFEETYRLFSVD